ncbi:MAG: c-type cytochrome [Arcobacteraceae bacterium]|nr:c-type cytochrome [Arcobacteraceae bacterium]
MKQTILSLIIIAFLLSLQFLLPQKEFKEYSDEELRQEALSRAMKPIPKTYEGLLKVQDNKNNLLTKEKIILGKELYFDAILSQNRDISCNTCHTIERNTQPVLLNTILGKTKDVTNCAACHTMDNSGTDRLTFSVGVDENPYKLNVQTILNSSLAKSLTWSGEVKTIQEQISNSIKSHFKMNISEDEVEQRLKADSDYAAKFKTIFNEDINFKNITKAIDAYVRTLLTRGSYDKFLDGDNDAISDEAKRGFANFINFGCKGCHTGMGVGGESVQRFPVRTNARIHDLRPNYSLEEGKIIDTSFPFENIGGFKGRDNASFFRVPILRNVTKTSPYFHNGAVSKIREAVDIMAKHQAGKNLTSVQIDEIVEFLKTLEGDVVDYGVFDEDN